MTKQQKREWLQRHLKDIRNLQDILDGKNKRFAHKLTDSDFVASIKRSIAHATELYNITLAER